jgi:hypothetical protein
MLFTALLSLQIPQKVCIRIVRTFNCQDRVGVAMPNKTGKSCRMYSTERAQTSDDQHGHPPHDSDLDLILTYENDLDTHN